MIRLWRRRRDLTTGGQEARERAERELAQTRAETPKYAQLARDNRRIRERNGLAEAFLNAARRAQP
jgi:hypothetical protein